MSLQFIGVDPESGQTGSPTFWVDETSGDIIAQSYIADDATRAECIEKNAPGHDKTIPAGETVIRVPAHMIQILREACDAAERAAVR
ncbi:hypothetical protein [Streptomyces sp. WAC01280]|uniref:hypothetical protein n=1 Tax=Streptomyces sp. WAC01280 TaxID=2487424 RepID=UPI000F782EFA|nr:hypothetical protein [Streptomyces sp. WAC01280]RSS59590.1 hypothetical protein EF909_06850 [Streptomyces sp. WAC01280]